MCVGCGGVGKTTTAAAMAVASARRGERTAVLTVDPARRLKDALGLGGLSNEPHRVALPEGVSFDALALDAKRAFDALVQRFAASEAAAERILANRLYQELSNELAGSAEYMAMEKLHELVHHHRYRTVILDTPPSANVGDLLAAPNRLVSLLASRAVKVLQAPSSLLSGVGSRTARAALSTLIGALQRWTGVDLLTDVSEFVSGFEHMLEGFSLRAEEVNRLLRAPTTAFVLVTTADPRTVETTISFHEELQAGGYPVAGIVANRTWQFPPITDGAEPDESPLGRRLWRNYRELRALTERDEAILRRLCESTGLPRLASIAATVAAPTSLAGLSDFADALLAPATSRIEP